MKKRFALFLALFSLILFASFPRSSKEEPSAPQKKFTMSDSFEKLLGEETPSWKHMQGEQAFQDLAFYKEIYQKNHLYQYEIDAPFRIPKIIHLIWLGPRPFPTESVENMRSFRAHHPDWTFCFWTDRKRIPPLSGMELCYVQDFDFKFLKEQYEEATNFGQKADILRYELLYEKGGLYIDHDFLCLRSFHGLHRGYDFYAGIDPPHEPVESLNLSACNALIGCKAHHSVIAKTIEKVLERWERLKGEFPASDLDTRCRRLIRQTYLPLTLGFKQQSLSSGSREILFPTCYFPPDGGFFPPDGRLPPFYATHFYAGAWLPSSLKKMTKGEKRIAQGIRRLNRLDRRVKRLEILSLTGVIGCCAAFLLISLNLKKIEEKPF